MSGTAHIKPGTVFCLGSVSKGDNSQAAGSTSGFPSSGPAKAQACLLCGLELPTLEIALAHSTAHSAHSAHSRKRPPPHTATLAPPRKMKGSTPTLTSSSHASHNKMLADLGSTPAFLTTFPPNTQPTDFMALLKQMNDAKEQRPLPSPSSLPTSAHSSLAAPVQALNVEGSTPSISSSSILGPCPSEPSIDLAAFLKKIEENRKTARPDRVDLNAVYERLKEQEKRSTPPVAPTVPSQGPADFIELLQQMNEGKPFDSEACLKQMADNGSIPATGLSVASPAPMDTMAKGPNEKGATPSSLAPSPQPPIDLIAFLKQQQNEQDSASTTALSVACPVPMDTSKGLNEKGPTPPAAPLSALDPLANLKALQEMGFAAPSLLSHPMQIDLGLLTMLNQMSATNPTFANSVVYGMLDYLKMLLDKGVPVPLPGPSYVLSLPGIGTPPSSLPQQHAPIDPAAYLQMVQSKGPTPAAPHAAAAHPGQPVYPTGFAEPSQPAVRALPSHIGTKFAPSRPSPLALCTTEMTGSQAAAPSLPPFTPNLNCMLCPRKFEEMLELSNHLVGLHSPFALFPEMYSPTVMLKPLLDKLAKLPPPDATTVPTAGCTPLPKDLQDLINKIKAFPATPPAACPPSSATVPKDLKPASRSTTDVSPSSAPIAVRVKKERTTVVSKSKSQHQIAGSGSKTDFSSPPKKTTVVRKKTTLDSRIKSLYPIASGLSKTDFSSAPKKTTVVSKSKSQYQIAGSQSKTDFSSPPPKKTTVVSSKSQHQIAGSPSKIAFSSPPLKKTTVVSSKSQHQIAGSGSQTGFSSPSVPLAIRVKEEKPTVVSSKSQYSISSPQSKTDFPTKITAPAPVKCDNVPNIATVPKKTPDVITIDD